MYKPSKPVRLATAGVVAVPIFVAVIKDAGDTKVDLPSGAVAAVPTVSDTGTFFDHVMLDTTIEAEIRPEPKPKPGSIRLSPRSAGH